MQCGSCSTDRVELWQDYGGFPTVPNETLKRWAAMIEANKTP
jgi:hypothetical protein